MYALLESMRYESYALRGSRLYEKWRNDVTNGLTLDLPTQRVWRCTDFSLARDHLPSRRAANTYSYVNHEYINAYTSPLAPFDDAIKCLTVDMLQLTDRDRARPSPIDSILPRHC
jgi:hypothetical protein